MLKTNSRTKTPNSEKESPAMGKVITQNARNADKTIETPRRSILDFLFPDFI
ncbi:MAG: hypothetical protein II194_05935 [Bacteroidales bacterium]|nr:hypothetical protein [Bacteroidales bacterium]